MIKKIAIGFIILALLILNGLRFWKLDAIPNGFHVDEVGSAVTLQCFVEKGCDAELTPWPLFGFMEYGQSKPPTYVYPGILWGKIFGTTVASLRGFSAFGLLLGMLGLFFLAKNLSGKSFGLAVVLAATVSPWSWVVTRVALESYFAPVFAIWGLYFFWRSARSWDWALSGFLFSCAMYTYPPARLQIPLLLVTLIFYEWGRRSIHWRSVLSFTVVFILSLWPMVAGYDARRFNEISILNHDFLRSIGSTGGPADIVRIFIHNYSLHLSPKFLFLTGDPSYVHSTGHLGTLSWLDSAALIIFIVFLALVFLRHSWQDNPLIKHRRWLLFLTVNFFIGIVPSALTYQELPHALRMCGSWPMMMLFTGFMWFSVAECLAAWWPVLALAGILSGGILTYQYFTIYPQESKGMFDYWVKDTAEQLRTPEDWQKFMLVFHRRNYHIRYFLVHRMGMTCKQANDLWWQLHDNLAKRGLF